MAVLESFGWRPEPPATEACSARARSLGAREGERSYLAAADHARAEQLMGALADSEIAAVFAARGGYGCTRLLTALDPAALQQNPKPIVGFSDITALLEWSLAKAAVLAVHGPTVTQLPRIEARSHQALARLLSGAAREGATLLEALRPLRGGRAEGILRGGNLSLVCALTGTPHALPLAGSVLLLEETNEPPYRIDRMLTQLRSTPGWDRLAGIVLGRFSGTNDHHDLDSLLAELAAAAPCPVVCDAPVGHGRQNVALPLGARVSLDSARGRLRLLEAGLTSPRSAWARGWRPPKPTVRGQRSGDLGPIRDALAAAVHNGSAPGFALFATLGGEVRIEAEAGYQAIVPEPRAMARDTRFDLASLTKPLATTTIAMRGVKEGWLALDEPVAETIPWLPPDAHWLKVTARHLLQHSSGLPDWWPLYAVARRRMPHERPGSFAIRRFYREALAGASFLSPPGERVRYSDVGFWLLGALLEAKSETSLDILFEREVAARLALKQTGFRGAAPDTRDDQRGARSFAATERCPWRGTTLQGTVHDENAFMLGGTAPHAGLFASAREVGRLSQTLLDEALGRSGPLDLSRSLLEQFWDAPPLPGGRYALGWDRPEPGGCSGGKHLSSRAVGHLGFTGCSLWIDREQEIVVVLLSNRVHPDRHDQRLRRERPQLHDLIIERLNALAKAPRRPAALT